MEGEAVGAVLQVLVQNLIDLSKEEFSLVRGLKKEAKKLGESMKTIQKYLDDAEKRTILDDVWNQELSKWEDFINSLLGVTSTKGNVIVITTRKKEVASTVSALHTHELQGLSKEDCWSIIKRRTFGKEEVPLGIEAIGTEIAEKCQGLPLAAIVVSGILRDKKSDEWHSIKENWHSSDEGGYITKILKLSFDNLSPPSLKKCFSYCSVFPKGHLIERRQLIAYWMAEGFLVADGSNDMESMGDKFINVLIQNSLLQTEICFVHGYQKVEDCVMHDLVHDLASFVLSGSHNANDSYPVRYMFLEEESSNVLKENAKYLRTLLFMDNIYSNMFLYFESLHVLTFGNNEVKELPSSIERLIHLRVLDINGSGIACLPDCIGKLIHLQTLIAWNSCLRKLPSTLKYLTNLRHLYIRDGVKLPAEIGRLTSLVTLEYFKVGDKDGWKIEELESLNDLKGKLIISKLERIDNKDEAEKAILSAKSKLLDLWLIWDGNRGGKTTNDENVLEGLQPHSNLKKLKIEGFKGKRFPPWTQKMEVVNVDQGCWVPLNNLIEKNLSWCSECEEIPMFGLLPNLTTLSLVGLRNVKSINCSFYGLKKGETRIVFPALKKFKLIWMQELTEWAKVESAGASGVKVFPHLQHLKIEFCSKLKGLPNGICTLNSLKKLAISSCPNLEDIGVQKSQGSLERLEIINC